MMRTKATKPRAARPRRARSAAVLSALCLVFLFGAAGASGQNVQHTENKADLALRSDLRVDPSTLGMSFSIPLAAYPGRAGHGLPVAVNYSSKVLRLDYRNTDSLVMSGLKTWTAVEFAEHTTAGWTSTLVAPRVEFTGMGQYYDSQGHGASEVCGPDPCVTGDYYVKRINVHLPDGSSHELRADDQPRLIPLEPFTGTFHSVDGTRMRFESNAGTPSVLYLPDGSRYLFPAYANGYDLTATGYYDRHGNRLSYDAAQRRWTDTLGRVVNDPLPPNPSPDTETYFHANLAGGSQATYTFRWKRLGDVLTPDPLTGQPPALRYPGSNKCSHNSYPTVSPALFNSTSDTKVCVERDANDNPVLFNPVVLAEVELPTGNKYVFGYTVYGEIDRVTLPAGGTESFTYAQVPTLGYAAAPYDKTNRGVVSRRANPGGGAPESVWTYAVTSASPYTVQTTAPDQTYSRRLLHRGLNTASVSDFVRFGFDDARAGMVYEERSFDASGAMLRRTLSQWDVTGPTPASAQYGSRDPRVTKTVALVLDTGGDALAQTITYTHDADLNVTSTALSGYATLTQTAAATGAMSAMPTPTPMRTDETTYLVNDPGLSPQTRDLYRARHMLSLPTSTRVRNSAGTIVAKGEVRYDESNYALLPCLAAPGWSDPDVTTVRGNATTARNWIDTTDTWVETHARFDACGSLRETQDGAGRLTKIFYDDSFGNAQDNARATYALPTRTESPVPDPSNTYGAAAPLVTTTVYDFSTGRATSTTDANNQTVALSYSDEQNVPDPLGRLRRVTTPGGGWTKYDYGATPGNLFIRTRAALDTTRNTDAYQFFDGMGRPYRTQTFENHVAAAQWVATDTAYDVMGRAVKASLPYRSALGAAPLDADAWASKKRTETEYDALGRVRTVTTRPDGAAVKSDYAGDRVLVTDQAGKQRISRTDALGRLVEVWEVRSADPSSGTEAVTFPGRAGVPTVAAGYRTAYKYDALGNLRKVEQGTQSRFFMYDSLGRLIRAKNPEQGSFTPDAQPGGDFPPLTDSSTDTPNSQWSQGYKYDAAGNVVKRRDARNVNTTYTYDHLNRNTTVVYSDTTPGVVRRYDGATRGLGREWKAEAAGVSLSTVSAYDVAGRPQTYGQQFWDGGQWGASFGGSLEYDLAGNVTRQVYPSGREATYTYDAAGRPASFSGTLGDGAQRAYSSGIVYDELGGMKREQYGTATPLYKRLFYNSRGQLTDIRLGTYHATDDAWWNRGAIINHYSQQAWAGSDQYNNGNLRIQEVFIPNGENPLDDGWETYSQRYDYDALNRLDRASEERGGVTHWQQKYNYDRWGNRTIDAGQTSDSSPGWDVPEPEFDTADLASTNRLYAPGDVALPESQRRMRYDAAGNLAYDTYRPTPGDGGTRVYDAENRMTRAQYLSGQTQEAVYTYDAAGRRVKRKAGVGEEVWQVYGAGGELLAEYAAHASPASPSKEYGYRAGELLITAEGGARANAALASAGATVAASSTHSANFPAAAAINGDRKGVVWGAGGGWNDATRDAYPDWLEVTFAGAKTIDEINVFTLQDNYGNPSEPTEAMTFGLNGLTDFEVQAWDGGQWVTVPNGGVSANNQVWRRVTFPAVVTTKIRVRVTGALDGYSRVTELEAWGPAGGGGGVNWLVTDHLGTPRMVVDQTGSLAGVRRHDYLPFGEELPAGASGRTAAQGYGPDDHVRQRFTGYERDDETGLDYAQARYYSKAQGRFTSVDPENAGVNIAVPQSWNGYTYALNNPVNYTDPNGLQTVCRVGAKIVSCDYVLAQIRQGNFETVTYTNATTGVSVTVRRADFYRTESYTKPDGTEGVKTSFNQTGFMEAAAGLANQVVQGMTPRLPDAGPVFRGFGGGADFGGASPRTGTWDCPSCPAFNDDPYNPDVVKGRQNARNADNTETAADAAKRIGFTRRIPPNKAPFNSHGQAVFTDGNRYITRDVDSHRGGAWKVFDRSGRRLGTYNEDLTQRIGP